MVIKDRVSAFRNLQDQHPRSLLLNINDGERNNGSGKGKITDAKVGNLPSFFHFPLRAEAERRKKKGERRK